MRIISSIIRQLEANARIVRERPMEAFVNACTAVVLLPLVGLCSAGEAALLWSVRRRWTLRERNLHVGNFTREWLAPLIFKLLGTEIEYRGLENFADGKYYVVVANHGSLLDVVAMLVVWCFRFISKLSVKWSPIGWMGRLSGQIFIDYKTRGASMDVIRAAVAEAPDFNFVFFGQGTRSLDGTVQGLKLGAMKIASEYGFSVIPVRIDGAHEVLPKGPFLGLRRGRKIVVTCGAPIPPRDDVEQFAEEVHAAILSL